MGEGGGEGLALALAIDVGTTSCRAAFYDAAGRGVGGRPVRLATPLRLTPDGGAEVDADVLLDVIAETIDGLLERRGAGRRPVAAVGVSTFWHSLLGLDQAGHPITPVYMWLDGRARIAAQQLRARLDEATIHGRTGCVLHATYWPAKLTWLRETCPASFRRVSRWVSFGDYLAGRLLGRTDTSVSLASGTGLFDQHAIDWDGALIGELGIDPASLPDVDRGSPGVASLLPDWAVRWPALRGVPWLPVVGDGACSNVGAGCASRDRLALMIGTSGALRALWRAEDLVIPWGVWGYRAGPDRVLIGGAINDGGSLFAWLRRTFRLPPLRAAEAAVAALPADGHGLTILPHWGGERSPHWAPDAHGAIAGLRLDTTPVEILRAALEAVALRLAAIEAILRPAVPEAREIVATGGALLRSPAWLQMMADAIGRPVRVSRVPEASSRGAALLALESAGRLPAPVETIEAPGGPVYEPVPAHTERFRAAADRQERLYARIAGT